MTEDFLCNRLRFLRNERRMSARELSLSLGQNESYINKIETAQRSLPMNVFFRICDVLDVTPEQFFSESLKNIKPRDREILELFYKLPPEQAEHFLEIIRFIVEK